MGVIIIIILIIVAAVLYKINKQKSTMKSSQQLPSVSTGIKQNNVSEEQYLRDKINAGEKCYVDSQGIIEGAIRGDSEAQWILGAYYLFEMNGFPRDLNKAVYWLSKAHEQGHVKATYDLGQIYFVEYEDIRRGTELITEAAMQSHPAAQRWLGISYLYGTEHEQNIEYGLTLLQSAADGGDATAQESLGQKYHLGHLVEKDLSKAETLLRKAAEQNKKGACLYMGELLWEKHGYLKSEDMYKDIELLISPGTHQQLQSIIPEFHSDWGKEAFDFFMKSLELGPSEEFGAEYFVGICYKFGLGVPKDPVLGKKFLTDALRIATQSDYSTYRIDNALKCQFD